MGAPSEVMVVAALRTELLFVRGPKAALGVGEKAREGLHRVLARSAPRGVAIVGYAGGLRPELPASAVVLADRVLDEETVVPVDPELLAKAKKRLPMAWVGPVFTDRELTRRERKALLGERALAVDMETSFLARELAARGIPFLVARVILDSQKEEAPKGWRQVFWAARALRCSWTLGKAAEALRSALSEAL